MATRQEEGPNVQIPLNTKPVAKNSTNAGTPVRSLRIGRTRRPRVNVVGAPSFAASSPGPFALSVDLSFVHFIQRG